MENRLCDYGCNQEANYQLKNGKYCCSKSYNSCPELKRKNSEGIKNNYKKNPAIFGYVRNLSLKSRHAMAWNRGLSKDTDIRIENYAKKVSDVLKQKYIDDPNFCKLSPEMEIKKKKKISETAKRNKLSGGLRIGSGRGKSQWYESIIAGKVYLRSTYELAYAKWLDENNIIWKQNLNKFPYTWKTEMHYYYPDFYLVESDEYIEIKGYKTEKDEAKWKEFPFILKVLMLEDLQKMGIL